MWQSIKISLLFHKSTHQTHFPFWLKRITVCKIGTKLVLLGFQSVTPWPVWENESKFQSYHTDLHTKHYHSSWKVTFCAELAKKSFCWDFEVLSPDHVTINPIFGPILPIAEKNFWKFSQFLSKTYIVIKIGTKMVLSSCKNGYINHATANLDCRDKTWKEKEHLQYIFRGSDKMILCSLWLQKTGYIL